MRIRVLGCYGAELASANASGEKNCYNTSGFLIDDTVMLDAGTMSSVLGLDSLVRIRHVLVSHVHFDHVKGLPFLADTVFGNIRQPIGVLGIREVLDGLKKHLLNDTLWPDFTRLPDEHSPTLELRALNEGVPNGVGHLRVTPIRVNHVIPATGFIIEDNTTALLYSGDTHTTTAIWEAAARIPNLRAVLIEASFPNAMADLAGRSGHLTPRLMVREFEKIGKPELPVFVYHMKPQYVSEIRSEVEALGIRNARCLGDGETLVV